MRFVNDTKELLNDIEKEEKRQDQLGIEETKQPVEEKPVAVKEEWGEGTVKTLVNLRKTPNKSGEILGVIKGGSIINISSSFTHPQFNKVKYKDKEGYVNKDYVKIF